MTRLVRAELTKLRTTRLAYGMAAAMAALAVLAVVAGASAAGIQGNPPLSADSLPMFVAGPVTPLCGAALLLGILGMTGEFRHQTVTQAFLVTPARGRVVAAKLVVYPLAGIALALATLAVAAAAAAAWLLAEGITPSLSDARLASVAGVALLGAGLCGLVGVGVGALVRNQVAALVGTLAWVLVVEGLLVSLVDAPSLGRWLPSAAAAAAITSPGGDHLSRLGGTLLLAAYALAFAAAGTRLVVRRDVTGIRHVVWDWNGTLFDDHAGVVAAINDALAALGLRSIDADAFRTHYTRPVQRFYERVAGRPIEPGEWRTLDDAYHDSYHARVERLGLAPDALAALAAAEAAGLTQSLLSMWRHQELVELVERLGIGRYFRLVDGLRVPGGEGKTEHLAAHLAALQVVPSAALVVGDTLDDLAAARAVGARCVLYDGGAHHRHALEATGVPVVDTLTAALAAAEDARPGR